MRCKFKLLKIIATLSIPIAFLTSCSHGIEVFDISLISFNSETPRTDTLFIYDKTPDAVTYDSLKKEIAQNEAIKQDVLNQINANGFYGVSTNDFDVSLLASSTTNATAEDLINPIFFMHEILVNAKSSKLCGKFIIPENFYKIQALPNDFSVSLSSIDLGITSYINPFSFNFFEMSENEIFDNLIQGVTNTPFSVLTTKNTDQFLYPYITRELNLNILEQLKLIDSRYNEFTLKQEHDYSVDFSNLRQITKDQLANSEKVPIFSELNILFKNSQIKTLQDESTIGLHLNNIKVDIHSIKLEDVDFSGMNDITHNITTKEYNQKYISKETIQKECDDKILNYLLDSINRMPVFPKINKDQFAIEVNYQDLMYTADGSTSISVNVTAADIPNNSISGNYSFDFTFKYIDARKTLRDTNLIRTIHDSLKPTADESNTIYINDVKNPLSVSVEELMHEVSNNTSLLDKITKNLQSFFPWKDHPITTNDYFIDFFGDSRSPTAGDYSEGDAEGDGNIVYIGIAASPNSSYLKDSTIDIDSKTDPIAIRVIVSDTKFDLSTLSFDTIGDQSNPYVLKETLDPTKIGQDEVKSLFDDTSSNSIKTKILSAIAREYKALSEHDLEFSIGTQIVDATTPTKFTVLISPSNNESKYIQGTKLISYWIVAPQKACSINDIEIDPSSITNVIVHVYYDKSVDWTIINKEINSTTFQIDNLVNQTIATATGIPYPTLNKDYLIDFDYFSNHHEKSYDLSSDHPTTIPAIRVYANPDIKVNKRLTGEFIIGINVLCDTYSGQLLTSTGKYIVANKDTSVKPTYDQWEHKFSYHVSGSKCGGELKISSIEYSLIYDSGILAKQIKTGALKTGQEYSVSDLKGLFFNCESWINGSFKCWCIGTSKNETLNKNSLRFVYGWHGIHTAWNNDNQASYIDWNIKCLGTDVGLYSGDGRNKTPEARDDIFSYPRLIITQTTVDTDEYTINWMPSEKYPYCNIRFGVRGLSNMYDHSNNRVDTRLF